MADTPSKPFFRGTSSKVIAAFLLAFTGIALALSITYFSFYELMGTVDQLSEPNKKLRTLNELFRRITSVDQQQRTEMVKRYKTPSAKLLSKSKDLFLILDTLKTMNWQDAEQLNRIYAMQDILHNRDLLLINYLHMTYEEAKNKTFLLQLDSLSDVLSLHTVPFDTTIITTQNQKTITSYIPVPASEEKNDRSFFKKLFKKKKGDTEETEPTIQVKEEISFIADTIPLTKKDSAVYHVSQVIKSLNTDQRSRNREMMLRELEFINVNTALLNELLTVLHEVETEEVNLMRENNAGAGQLVNQSIERMVIFLIVFFLTAALLLFFILIDISKSNYYRNQLIQAKDEAEELSQVKQRFLSNMSHEIRTPLQSIIGYAEQLKSTENNAALGAIQASGEHLLHIVNEVLDYSRIESGKLILNNQPFRLRPCFEEVLSAIAIQADQKGLELREEVDVPYDLVVSGDAFRLRQILYNILSNAVKFTHTGFVQLKTLTVETDDRIRCRIRIEDSGIGIATEVQSRIFNQFEQGYDQHNHYGGTGLGLTIVKSLVDALQGTIELTSTVGEGSVFTIELSFAGSTKTELEQHMALSPVINTRAVNHLMIMDDDPLILNLCSIILEKHGIAHTISQNPETIIQTPLADVTSHVLVDIRMPTVSGIDVCKALRQQQKPGLIIIALTAHALPTEQTALLQQGFDAILPKPFREHDLLTVLGMVAPIRTQPTQSDIDFTAFDQMTFHDKALQVSVLKQFTEETEVDLRAFNEALKTKNQSTLLSITHTLAGRIGQVGGLALSRKLKETEQELTTHSLNDNLLDRLTQRAAEVKTFQKIVTDRIPTLR